MNYSQASFECTLFLDACFQSGLYVGVVSSEQLATARFFKDKVEGLAK